MNVAFAAGGTGGHINPALAIADKLKEVFPDTNILFIGSPDGLEAKLVKKAGYDFASVKMAGIQRKLTPHNIKLNIQAVHYYLSAGKRIKKIFDDFSPDLVIGTGGYVTGTVLKTAIKCGIKTALHESNSLPGVSVKMLAPKADLVMLGTEDAKKHLEAKNEVIVTGLPVRGELLNARKDLSRKKLGIPNNKYLVLSFGGSLGAKPLNDAMYDILLESAENDTYYHIHSVGTNGSEFLDKFKEQGFTEGEKGLIKGNVEVRQYIDDMDTCMSACDLVIGRAGASSLSEIEAMGKASILIPSPYVAENHQFHNAMALVNRGAGSIIEEKDLTSQSLKEAIDSMLSNPAKLIQIEENAKNMAITDARERIADIIISLAK